jgi:hypothetical protein
MVQQSDVRTDHIANIEQVTHRFQITRGDTVSAGGPGGTEPLNECRDDVQQ